MTKYNFVPMRRVIMPPLRVTLSKSQMHITQEAYELLGKPESLLVYFDKENSAIKLEPNSEDVYARKIKIQKERYYSISITLAKFMPLGVYELTDRKQLIFVRQVEVDE